MLRQIQDGTLRFRLFLHDRDAMNGGFVMRMMMIGLAAVTVVIVSLRMRWIGGGWCSGLWRWRWCIAGRRRQWRQVDILLCFLLNVELLNRGCTGCGRW